MIRLRTESGELTFEKMGGAVPVGWATVDPAQWRAAARALARDGATLVSLWGSDRRDLGDGLVIMAAYSLGRRARVRAARPAREPVRVPVHQRRVPGCQSHAACDVRPARRSRRGRRRRSTVAASRCLAGRLLPAAARRRCAPFLRVEQEHYAFVPVTGDGVHEIPVGPVHAGHHRAGPLPLLGRRREGAAPRGSAWATCTRASTSASRACRWPRRFGSPAACRATRRSPTPGRIRWRSSRPPARRVPARAAWLRALLLERERVGNHLGDLGALGNDAALAVGLAQFSRLRELWLRVNDDVFGHRLMMDCIVPGGTRIDPDASRLEAMRQQCARPRRRGEDAAHDLRRARRPAGPLPDHRRRHAGARGAARPARPRRTRERQVRDLRVDVRSPPYDPLDVKVAIGSRGDVAARVAVRFDELVRVAATDRGHRATAAGRRGALRAAGRGRATVQRASAGSRAGAATCWSPLEVGTNAQLRRCHCHDPSWQNWPVLEHAVIGNIVPDFPLINKSFNLTYSGVDL